MSFDAVRHHLPSGFASVVRDIRGCEVFCRLIILKARIKAFLMEEKK
jgi:hypothetical protein